MTDGSPALEDLAGLWTRSLLAWPDGRRDETTVVDWLQGPALFVDLRSPADRPSFEGVRRLRDLTFNQIAWLARQEGFAGELVREGAFFEWRRAIDYQPTTGAADAGSLRFEGDVLVERGRDAPYVEHWRRSPARGDGPAEAFALQDADDGRAGFLVRVGDRFMYARNRLHPPPAGASLAECVSRAPDLAAAQEVVDFEISMGAVLPTGAWRIDRSSLPFREGRDLVVTIDAAKGAVDVAETSPHGGDSLRRWRIRAMETI